MILIFNSKENESVFYSLMGKFFASLDIAKELERQVYNKDNSVWYLDCFDNEVIGFAALFDNGKHYFLDNLYVLPQHRNKGVARDIVREIVSNHTDKPILCIANNPYALKIFCSLGFKEVGKIGKYKKLVKH